jgi:hypothetical protein
MPIDDTALRGTEANGSLSAEYCKYCYVNGKFIDPEMTIGGMSDLVQTQMEKMQIPAATIQLARESLPHLKRWKNKTIIG